MLASIKGLVLAALITLIPTILLWAPFIIRLESFWGIPLPQEGTATIVANYDGPLYVVIAKTLYKREQIKSDFSFDLPTEYYASHFPLFPLLIRGLRELLPDLGYLYSMLTVTLISSILATYYFYKFIKDFIGKENALFASFVFTLLPARWLISHSVGSADPLFVATVLASIYHFRKKEYLIAGIWGGVAQLTKSPAILLFVAYFIYFLSHQMNKLITHDFIAWLKTFRLRQILPIFLIPLALIGVFAFYQQVMGNFFAYFNSGDNIHLFFPPFQIFNFSQPWVGTFWLEEVILVYLFIGLGLIWLIKKKELILSIFVGIFFFSILFVSHRDVIRYALPIVPFLFAAFSETIKKPEFKYIFLLLIIPIYLFSLAYISQNVMPISDWRPFL